MGGPPVLYSPVAKESEYCHALVHRKEGEYIGELGMLGFNNCDFWFGRTGYHPLYEVVKKEAIAIGNVQKADNAKISRFVSDVSKMGWDPEIFNSLCANALKSKDQELIDFCNEIHAKEWNILMEKCNSIVNPGHLSKMS